jgi:hypothetical protein
VAAQAPEKLGADGVEQVVPTEVQAVDDGKRRLRFLHLGHRDRAVQGHTGLGVSDNSWS